jgi:hypothetical protein
MPSHTRTLDITTLENWLWEAACKIRGPVDAKIAAEEARRDALDDLFRTLVHHLMTAKVQIPIDTDFPHPEDSGSLPADE